MLANSRLHTQNNLSENYRQFGYAPQKGFASLGQKSVFKVYKVYKGLKAPNY